MKKTSLSALVVIAITAQLAGCSGNTPVEQSNKSSSVVSGASEPQSSAVSTTSSTSETSKPQSSTTATTSSVPEVSEPQNSTVSTTSEPETSSSESNSQAEETSKDDTPQWTETEVSGERFVNTDNISSRVTAIQGSNTVKQYRLNDKVNVVAKTNTNYFKLADGSFIHSDYLSESKITVQQPTQSTQGEVLGAEHLKFVELDDGTLSVEEIDPRANDKRALFVNVVIPAEYNGKKVTQIARQGFSSLRNLKSITIPEGITVIGDWAFSNCESLESVKLPNSLKSLGYFAFQGCGELTTVTVGNGIENIERHAFQATPFLNNQHGVRYLGNWVIDCEDGTTAVNIKDGTVGIAEQAFTRNYTKLEYISIPDSVKFIMHSALSSCSVDNVKIPNGITYLDGYLLYSSKVVNLTIPRTVTYIDPDAIGKSKQMDNIYFAGTEEEWNEILQNSGWDGKISYIEARFDGTPSIRHTVNYEIHFNSEGPAIP
ncbi:MAG: leucine-rich repeat domain-containing protein [Lachnospiraceae bacterium]|nr:leucine-rich repeat domain-containing protein [Ruminococcus sp.]MCM1275547.1 leucine-rich repeat domain-containing protein [Lachnospiraceae bacterium]